MDATRALPFAVVLIWALVVVLSPLSLLAAISGASGAGDFQWSGARLLAEGVDPYRAALDERFELFIRAQSPNYLHALYVLFLPLGLAPFGVARVIWAVLTFAMLVGAAVVLGRAAQLRGWRLSGLVGLFMCSAPGLIAVAAGQQTALVLFMSVLAYSSRRQVGQGVAMALAVTKYSFAPLAFVLLARRRWGAVGAAAAVAAGSVAVFSVWTRSNPLVVAVEPLVVGRQMSRGAGDVMTLLGILIDAERSAVTYAVSIGLALALTAAGWRVLREAHWVEALACAALISLMTLPHLLYDYSLLLPVLVAALRWRPGPRKVAVVVAVSYFWYGWLVDVAGFERLYVAPSVAFHLGVLGGLFVSLVWPSWRARTTDVEGSRRGHEPLPTAA